MAEKGREMKIRRGTLGILALLMGIISTTLLLTSRLKDSAYQAQKLVGQELTVTGQGFVQNQKATVTITSANGHIEVADVVGILLVEPPYPGCKKDTATIDTYGNVTINWKCPTSEPTQLLTQLRIPNQNFWTTVYINPTLVDQK